MTAKQEIVHAAAENMPAIVDETSAIISMIERAASNPAVDIDKMERLLLMQERVVERRSKGAYYAALSQMQPELPEIDENGAIKHKENGPAIATYALWEDINDAIRPVLATHGFSLTFKSSRADGLILVTGILAHREGHYEETTMELPIDGSGAKNAVQAVGSSVSYGKRYAAMLLLNLTTRYDPTDDDGRSATKQKAGTSSAQAKKDGLWPEIVAAFGNVHTKRGLDKAMAFYKAKVPQSQSWLGQLAELYEDELVRVKSEEFGLEE